jgi:protein-tyrosine-phosphatase
MKKWSTNEVFIYTAGVSPAKKMHPSLLNVLSDRRLPHPEHKPRLLDFPCRYFDYIFLLDERITPLTFRYSLMRNSEIIDWRLPAFPDYMNGHKKFTDLKPEHKVYFKELEHRIRILTCTLYASLDENVIYKRMNEIAGFNQTFRHDTEITNPQYIQGTMRDYDPLEQSKSSVAEI